MTASMPQRIQRFEVTQPLGRGGMGSVYRARDPQLDRDVAIKILSGGDAGARAPDPHDTLDLRTEGPATSEDLVREARMMAQLSHPNVLPVYEVGVADGAVYVVMELVEGTDLRAWLATARTPAEILDVFAQAGRGLLAAHARDIVHRDFKPDNVLVGADGRVRVADFGLSRLATRAAGSMLRIDDGRGTPRYMAPELWRGDPATPRSDTYALCAALSEALGPEQRLLPARVRAVIRAGQDADPMARPSLAQVVATIANPSRRRRWGVGAALVAIAAVVGAVVLVGRGSTAGAACTLDPELFTGRWDAATRAAVSARLAGDGSGGLGDTATAASARIVALLDDQRREIEAQAAEVCARLADETSTAAQARGRTACLERRAFELGSVVEQLGLPDRDVDLERVEDRVQELPRAADCIGTQDLAPPADRAAVIALYRRWTALDDRPAAELVAEAAAIERAAAAVGDLELEVRAAVRLGVAHREGDELQLADEALQRAYRRGIERRLDAVAALALVERSRVASARGDAAAAHSLAGLALDLADKPTTPPRTRARLLGALGHADVDRGDYAAAIPALERGLAALAETGRSHPSIELGLRLDVGYARVNLEGQEAAAVAYARETVELATRAFGSRDLSRARALNLLAYTLRVNGDVSGALPVRREAVELATAVLPPGSALLVGMRTNLADDLSASGDYEPARLLLVEAVAQAGRVPALARSRAGWIGDLGITTFASGRHADGLELLARAVEELTSQRGKHHPSTLEYRSWLAWFELELGRLDDAERQIAAMEEGYRARPEPTAIRLAVLSGVYTATLVRRRGGPRDAETLVRAALATATELGVRAEDHIDLLLVLAACLVDQRRWADARAPLEQALELGADINDVVDRRAEIEIKLALVERALGDADAARERAVRAKSVLAHHPSRIMAGLDVDAFFAAATARPSR
jgi:tetratricopeptide (TPR) repeat protein